jgi:hypothetical protein
VQQAPARSLAIDAAEWFHAEELQAHVSPRHWRRLPARAEENVRRAVKACEQARVHATWFVTGELAARAPALLRQLVDAGHEVGLLVTEPRPLDEVVAADRDAMGARWERALVAIEVATALAVRGMRALRPVRTATGWWQHWAASSGLRYDATSVAGDASGTVRDLDGSRCVRAATFACWRLDLDPPRIDGLPPAVAAALAARRAGAESELRALLASAGSSIATRLDAARLPAPVRSAPPTAAAVRPASTARLAIVVPLKDEAAGIASLARELEALTEDLADLAACEFVLVDDGSSDDTWRLLGEHFGARPNAKLVRHERNRGIAAAIATGIRATDAEIVASIDGDLSYDPRELRAMLALIANADVVTASPYHRDGGVKNVPSWRLLLSRTLSAAYRVLLRSPVRTWTSCFRVYRRVAVVGLPVSNEGFLGTAELLVRVLRRGGRVVEHPCVLEARLFGVSKLKVLRTVLGHLRLLVAVALRRVR